MGQAGRRDRGQGQGMGAGTGTCLGIRQDSGMHAGMAASILPSIVLYTCLPPCVPPPPMSLAPPSPTFLPTYLLLVLPAPSHAFLLPTPCFTIYPMVCALHTHLPCPLPNFLVLPTHKQHHGMAASLGVGQAWRGSTCLQTSSICSSLQLSLLPSLATFILHTHTHKTKQKQKHAFAARELRACWRVKDLTELLRLLRLPYSHSSSAWHGAPATLPFSCYLQTPCMLFLVWDTSAAPPSNIGTTSCCLHAPMDFLGGLGWTAPITMMFRLLSQFSGVGMAELNTVLSPLQNKTCLRKTGMTPSSMGHAIFRILDMSSLY